MGRSVKVLSKKERENNDTRIAISTWLKDKGFHEVLKHTMYRKGIIKVSLGPTHVKVERWVYGPYCNPKPYVRYDIGWHFYRVGGCHLSRVTWQDYLQDGKPRPAGFGFNSSEELVKMTT